MWERNTPLGLFNIHHTGRRTAQRKKERSPLLVPLSTPHSIQMGWCDSIFPTHTRSLCISTLPAFISLSHNPFVAFLFAPTKAASHYTPRQINWHIHLLATPGYMTRDTGRFFFLSRPCYLTGVDKILYVLALGMIGGISISSDSVLKFLHMML